MALLLKNHSASAWALLLVRYLKLFPCVTPGDFRLLEVLGGDSLGSLLEAVYPVLNLEDFRPL